MTLEQLKDKILEQAVTIIVGLLSVLIGMIVLGIAPLVVPAIIQGLPQKTALRILSLLLVILILETLYLVYLHLKLRKKLKAGFGIKWDRHGLPYCPNCEKSLHGPSQGQGGDVLKCFSCGKTLGLYRDDTNRMPFSEAKQQILAGNSN